jgi:hypothetical protein
MTAGRCAVLVSKAYVIQAFCVLPAAAGVPVCSADVAAGEPLAWQLACFRGGLQDETAEQDGSRGGIVVWALRAGDGLLASPRGVPQVWPPAVLLLDGAPGGLWGDLPRVSLPDELLAWPQDEPRAERLPALPQDELQGGWLLAGS